MEAEGRSGDTCIGEFDDYPYPEYPTGATEEELAEMRRRAKEYNEQLHDRLDRKYKRGKYAEGPG